MMKIAAICAHSPGHNTGMLSVDMALVSLHKRVLAERGVSLTFFNVEADQQVDGEGVSIHYQKLTSVDDLEQFDRVLFWGDFLHAWHYQERGLMHRAERAYGTEFQDKFRAWVSILRLAGASDELLGKVISVGGTIYINKILCEQDPDYIEKLARLLKSARLVAMREPFSAALVQKYSGRLESAVGCDCAFLLKPMDGFGFRDVPKSAGGARIGYSFARTAKSVRGAPRAMAAFTKRLARAVRAEQVNLEWLGTRGKPLEDFRKKLELIRSCDFIVTDTYHCAINAWREGVPAICIGLAAERSKAMLADKKKEILYSMFGMHDFYFYFEEIDNMWTRASAVKRAKKIIKDQNLIGAICNGIEVQARQFETRILEAIF